MLLNSSLTVVNSKMFLEHTKYTFYAHLNKTFYTYMDALQELQNFVADFKGLKLS